HLLQYRPGAAHHPVQTTRYLGESLSAGSGVEGAACGAARLCRHPWTRLARRAGAAGQDVSYDVASYSCEWLAAPLSASWIDDTTHYNTTVRRRIPWCWDIGAYDATRRCGASDLYRPCRAELLRHSDIVGAASREMVVDCRQCALPHPVRRITGHYV